MNITNHSSPNTLIKRIQLDQDPSKTKDLILLISNKINILNIKFIQSSPNPNKNNLSIGNTLKKKSNVILTNKSKRSSFEEDDQANLEKIIKEKEEKLEKYRKSEKESQKINELEGLIEKWRRAGQEAMADLLSEINKQSNERKDLVDLMNAYKIDPELLHFDEKNGDFY